MALPSSFLHRTLLTAISAATLAATTAQAAPSHFMNARTMAMGGTGVATAHPATAAAVNPAMMAATHHDWSDDFGLILPSLNVSFADEEEVLDQVDDIQDTIDRFDDLAERINDLKNDPISGLPQVPTLQAEARLIAGDLLKQLEDFNKDTVRINAGAGLSLAIPSPTLAVGFFSNGSLTATVRGELDDRDLDLLRDIANNSLDPEDFDLDTDLKSRGRLLAAAVVEAGISFAHALDLGNDHVLQLGISPKFVQLRTFQYTAEVSNFDEDDFDGSNYETEKSGFNLDIGAAYAFGDNKQWNAGLTVKNLIPMELDSAQFRADEEKYTLELKPKVTAAIAHKGNYHVLTAEVELTKQKGFGYADDTQWVAVGAEFDAWRFAQLRVGARHNLASNEDNAGIEEKTQFTAGIGLNPFGLRLDIAGLVSDSDLGAAIELGAAF